jgi:hypothetical protein
MMPCVLVTDYINYDTAFSCFVQLKLCPILDTHVEHYLSLEYLSVNMKGIKTELIKYGTQ